MTPPTAYRTPHPLAAAKPTRKIFDAWNSSSTGHQRADNNLSGSTSWRESRSRKLEHQFSDTTRQGGKRLADTVGAGSEGWGVDGRLENGAWTRGAVGLRGEGQIGVREAFRKVRKTEIDEDEEDMELSQNVKCEGLGKEKETLEDEDTPTSAQQEIMVKDLESASPPAKRYPQILRGLTIYINGSTFPLVSDHKLKQMISQHGGHLSIHLGRTVVTHVIIGTPNGYSGKGGAGGGLAGSKIQKEIAKVRGKGVKFVSAEWVLESIKAGVRLPEARFTTLKLATKDQKSVYGMFGPKTKMKDEELENSSHG